MSSQLKTVWVWLPGQTHPIIAGRFEIQIRAGQPIGSFVYDPTYVAHATSFSLDPAHLILNHKRPDKKYETRLNKGLFGVFRDVCPEGYGRDLLNYRFGREDEPLSESSQHFGLEPREAAAWLIESAATINDRWLAEMLQAGVSEEFCTSRQIASFTFAKMIARSPGLTLNAADHLGKGTPGVRRKSGSS